MQAGVHVQQRTQEDTEIMVIVGNDFNAMNGGGSQSDCSI